MRYRSGQATLESALLIPAVMLVLLVLLQPVVLLTTHMVMASAAAEGARLAGVVPTSGMAETRIVDLCRMRMEALPPSPVFHRGDAGAWEVTFAEDDDGATTVTISHEVQLLPLVAQAYVLIGGDPDGAYTQTVSSRGRFAPQWVEGSYEEWSEVWDG